MATHDTPPATPLWKQVLADLEDRLVRGEITGRFPTDRELVEHYGVSRHTVREAVRYLKARGIIERERGRGSFVAQPEFLQPLGTLYSIFRAVEAQGATQTSDVIALDTRTDARAARRFGLPTDEELVHLERLRYADRRPLALDTVWLPPDLGQHLLDVDFTHTALYDELERRAGVTPTAGSETITPLAPDDDLAELLELEDGEALLRIERISKHQARTIECRITLIRGSRFALHSRWPETYNVAPLALDPGR